MKYQVHYSSQAKAHLVDIYRYIERQASFTTADRFTTVVVDFCDSLEDFPQRGSRRDDLLPGLRIVGFRRRVSVAFTVTENKVEILGIYYGGVDFEADFQKDD